MIAMGDADQFLSFLHSLSDMGAAMRKVITKTVTSPDIYESITSGNSQIWYQLICKKAWYSPGVLPKINSSCKDSE